jgi:hypothetical protein
MEVDTKQGLVNNNVGQTISHNIDTKDVGNFW